MLSKRTNILFDQELWKLLNVLSRRRKVSIGKLVREAVQEKYENKEKKIKAQRERAFNQIEKIRSTIKHSFTSKEIREMIEDGRKY